MQITENTLNLQNLYNQINNLLPQKSFFPNGINWTPTNVIEQGANFVYNANGIWVAACANGVYYSINGKSWEISNLTEQMTCIHYANGLWVAGSNIYADGSGIYYSTDGLKWTISNITNMRVYDILYNNGYWVASGQEGILYSTNGQDWTESAVKNYIEELIYGNGVWIALASDGQSLYRSTTPTSWSTISISSIISTANYSIDSIYFANGRWLIYVDDKGTGTDDSCFFYSTNGLVWTQNETTDSRGVGGIHYANGLWVRTTNIVNSNIPSILYSSDGITWETVNDITSYAKQPYYANGIWIIGSKITPPLYRGVPFYYSFDGKTWTVGNVDGDTTYINQVYNANGIWVAATSNGLYYSVTWESTT